MSLHKIILLIFSLSCASTSLAVDYKRLMKIENDSLVKIANRYAYTENHPDSALICLTIASEKLKNSKEANSLQAAGVHMNLWYLYFFCIYDHSQAYANLVKTKDILDNLKANGVDVTRQYAILYQNYGCMYETLGEQTEERGMLQDAFDNFRKAFYLAAEQNNHDIMTTCFSNLVWLGYSLDSLDSVKKEFDIYAKTDQLKSDRLSVYTRQMYEGYNRLNQNDVKSALELFTGQEDMKEYEMSRYRIIRRNNIARCLLKMGEYRQAMAMLDSALDMASPIGLLDAKLEIYKLMTESAESANDSLAKAINQSKYLSLKDSLLNYQQIQGINRFYITREVREIRDRMRVVQEQDKTLKIIICISIIILLSTGTLLVLKIRHNRVLNEKNRTLYEKNVALLSSKDTSKKIRKTDLTNRPEEETISDELEAVLEKINAWMDSNTDWMEPDFSVETLSHEINEKYRTVSKAISLSSECNFSQLLNRRRIEEVCRRIESVEFNSHTLEAIANSVGFRSRSAFSAAFKKFTGMTPSQYQTAAKNLKK